MGFLMAVERGEFRRQRDIRFVHLFKVPSECQQFTILFFIFHMKHAFQKQCV